MAAFKTLLNTSIEDQYSVMPQDLYSGSAVREMDRVAIEEYGVDGFELMNKAARFSFHALIKQWPKADSLIVLCGSGNNAGDGYIVAALAKKRGWNVQVFFASEPDKLQGDAAKAYQMCISAKVSCTQFDEDTFQCLTLSNTIPSNKNTVIVDALLGTGLNTDVKGLYADIIHAVNNSTLPVLAIDIPSGLCADTGQAFGITIIADLTATFIGLKVGLLTGSGRHYSGKIVYSDLALDQNNLKHIQPIATRLDLHELLTHLPPRPQDAHKGSSGRVILVGGDIAYGGAIILAAHAAARMGAGLTTVITQECHRSALLSTIPEVMVFTSQNMQEIEEQLSKADVVVVGPGLGQSAWSEKVLTATVNTGKQLVIDADALNLLSEKFSYILNDPKFKKQSYIYTPHPGEAARLLDSSTLEIQSDRVLAGKALQEKCGGHVLLKGSGSLIFSCDESISLCPYGNPGMASGGMGDVLSGMIGGLLAQRLEPKYALQLAVCLHAKAADMISESYGERGLLASDLIPNARQLLNTQTHHNETR